MEKIKFERVYFAVLLSLQDKLCYIYECFHIVKAEPETKNMGKVDI